MVDKNYKNLNYSSGKYVEKSIPEPLVVCDRSGFTFLQSDVEEQMMWAGNSIVGTGLFVGKPFLDELNETNRPFMPNPNEFKPISNARPIQYTKQPNIIEDEEDIGFQKPLNLYDKRQK